MSMRVRYTTIAAAAAAAAAATVPVLPAVITSTAPFLSSSSLVGYQLFKICVCVYKQICMVAHGHVLKTSMSAHMHNFTIACDCPEVSAHLVCISEGIRLVLQLTQGEHF